MDVKRSKLDLDHILDKLASEKKIEFKKYTGENLDVDYSCIFAKNVADEILSQLEESIEYYSGDLTKVKVFGKWHDIPRQQVAYGDDGMKYTFSGTTIPAKPWPKILLSIRNFLNKITGYSYNFVLVNKYRSGKDHIGEHRDDEKELDKSTPIASISFGQTRTFVLKHRDARKKGDAKRDIVPGKQDVKNFHDVARLETKERLETFKIQAAFVFFCGFKVKIDLEHGTLLLMNAPTNEYWYHSLPPRKSALGMRINLTFRKINM